MMEGKVKKKKINILKDMRDCTHETEAGYYKKGAFRELKRALRC